MPRPHFCANGNDQGRQGRQSGIGRGAVKAIPTQRPQRKCLEDRSLRLSSQMFRVIPCERRCFVLG